MPASAKRRCKILSETILKLEDITKTYPGVKALDNVSLSFNKGEIHAIMGENGAGKSTLIKVIAGAITPDSGTVTMEGHLLDKLTPQMAIDNGIAVIYQEFNLFEALSAAENIFLGEKVNNSQFVDFKEMEKEAVDIFNKFNVTINPKTEVRKLSPAHKQIVEISKSIHRNAKIIIMDEPTAPLTLAEVHKFFELIKDLKNRGITIIYISHRLEEIFAIADRVSVLRDGTYITTKDIKDTNRKDLISLMVGRELKNNYPPSTVEPSEVALEVKHVTGNGVRDISFNVRKGEILGVSGLVGSGRTELVRVIYGAEKLESGEILIENKPVKINSPSRALQLGIGLIPEDRKHHGAFLRMTIAWNICISNIKQLSKHGFVLRKAEKQQAQDYCSQLNIKTPSLEQKVLNLSGGNQQKVVLAKVLAAQTNIIIFDEPTRGIDVGAREEIYQLMRKLSNSGKAIIMISSDMEELLGMSDRIVVMSEGKMTGEVLKAEFSQDYLLELASAN